MFVIEREGHLGFWWDGESKVFVEEKAGIFPSRSSCLEYLKQFHSEDKAIEGKKKAPGKLPMLFRLVNRRSNYLSSTLAPTPSS